MRQNLFTDNKEFYVNNNDYEAVNLDGNEQSYFSPGFLNDLFVLGGEKEEFFKLSSNNSNFKEILNYSKDETLLNFKLKNRILSDEEINKIKLIENNFIFNKQEFSGGSKVYDLNFEEESIFSSYFESTLRNTKDEIHDLVKKKLGFLDEELDVEIGTNFNLFINGFVKKGIEHCFLEVDKNFNNKKIEFIPSVRSIPNRFVSRNNLATYFDTLIDKVNSSSFGNLDSLNHWVKEFKIADEITIDSFGSSGVSEISLIKGDKRVNLTDVGYGVSQLLPILIRLCLFDDKFVIIEEPETNLHPALQSKLADFLISTGKNRTIMVETHSEYLIRKLQVLINNKSCKGDDLIIHYFFPPSDIPERERQVKTINFKKNGIIDGAFGTGFTDEANNLAFSLFQMTKSQEN